MSQALCTALQSWNLTGDSYSIHPGDKPWISEMYGYSYGCAMADVWHKVDYSAMLYPGYFTTGQLQTALCTSQSLVQRCLHSWTVLCAFAWPGMLWGATALGAELSHAQGHVACFRAMWALHQLHILCQAWYSLGFPEGRALLCLLLRDRQSGASLLSSTLSPGTGKASLHAA